MIARIVECLRSYGQGKRTSSWALPSLALRLAIVAITTIIVTGAFVTALAVFWRASATPTSLDGVFAGLSDSSLIALAVALLLLAASAIRVTSGVLGRSHTPRDQ